MRYFLVALALTPIALDAGASENSIPVRQRVSAEIQKMRQAKPPSRSSGTLRVGRLEIPAELPKPDGIGYFVSHPDRHTNSGADRMVFGLMRLGLAMHERLGPEPHHRVLINEISDRDGGKQKRHINHQMGLDVDLGLYATDLEGNPVRARWLKFDEDGLSPKKKLRFDAERNWVLLESIIENETFGEIRAVLLANWLKKKLLAHAEALAAEAEGAEAKRLKSLIRRAEELVRQPESSSHDTHFHLSLKWKSRPTQSNVLNMPKNLEAP